MTENENKNDAVIDDRPSLIAVAEPLSFEELLKALERYDYAGNTHWIWPSVEVVVEKANGGHLDIMERDMLSMVGTMIRPTWDHVFFPAFLVGFTYLQVCKDTGETPSEALAPFWAELIANIHYCGSGGEQDFFKGACDLLSVIPESILEPIFLASPTCHFHLAPSIPTPAVIEHLIVCFNEHKGFVYQSGFAGELSVMGDSLKRFGVHAISPFTKALSASKPHRHRLLLVRALVRLQAQGVPAALAAALNDKSKKVRVEAMLALGDQEDTDAVLEALRVPFSKRRKDARWAALSVLVDLPFSEARTALVEDVLANEKIEELREKLEALLVAP